MSFVDECDSRVLDLISVRSVWPNRHQDDGMIASETEIHALLKARTFAATHFDVGDDVGAHGAHDDELEIDFNRHANPCPSF